MSELFFFNPGHEAAILNDSPYYMSPANVVTMQKDLAYLPAWYAHKGDYIFVESDLPTDFIEYLSSNLNNNIAHPAHPLFVQDNLSDIPVHLWGISPQAVHFFEEFNRQYNTQLEIPAWNPHLRNLSSRHTAKVCLEYICDNIPTIARDITPLFFTDISKIETLVRETEHQLIAKAPFSSSGRGLLWLPIGQLTRTEIQILHGILKKQQSVSIEKVLRKKLDFAMEFSLSENGEVNFEGYSLFSTNTKGAYIGNILDSQHNISNTIEMYVESELLHSVRHYLMQFIRSEFANIYSGCIGVDMMIYDENGKWILHPCLEINVRDNMGLIALRISQKHLADGTTGMFYIDFNTQNGELLNDDRKMKEEYPPVFLDGKLQKGYLSLCPVNSDTKYRAYILTN